MSGLIRDEFVNQGSVFNIPLVNYNENLSIIKNLYRKSKIEQKQLPHELYELIYTIINTKKLFQTQSVDLQT